MMNEQRQKVSGSELTFISIIAFNGLSVTPCSSDNPHTLEKCWFTLTRLSITQDTWIASGFNTYIVKIKQ